MVLHWLATKITINNETQASKYPNNRGAAVNVNAGREAMYACNYK